jgi:hypothetical protein
VAITGTGEASENGQSFSNLRQGDWDQTVGYVRGPSKSTGLRDRYRLGHLPVGSQRCKSCDGAGRVTGFALGSMYSQALVSQKRGELVGELVGKGSSLDCTLTGLGRSKDSSGKLCDFSRFSM